jgi:hypothetical protein
LVFAGLWLETLAEKEWFRSLNILIAWKKRKRWGEWLVVIGVGVEITFNFLTNDAEVLGGSVELVANSNIRYTFRIPPQNPALQFPNDPGNSPQSPQWVVATNFSFTEK